MPIYDALPDKALLVMYDQQRETVKNYEQVVGHLEQEILRRMESRAATAIPSEEFVCEAVIRYQYDQPSFGPLKELFNESDLGTCFIPAHQETVEVLDKWTTQKVLALAKRYGQEAIEIVEKARLPAARQLRFARRDAGKAGGKP